MINFFKEYFGRFDATYSKSTILKSLLLLVSICIVGLVGLLKAEAPSYILITFLAFIGLPILVFLFTYLFCLFKDRESLKSESYQIRKLAIERGLYGDSLTGRLDEKIALMLSEKDSKGTGEVEK